MRSTVTNKAIARLPDLPLVGERYMNSGSEYAVVRLYDGGGVLLARVRRPKDGWSCIAHRPALYQMEDGSIELQWDYSTGGHFE